MDHIQTLKDKITKGEISDDELSALLGKPNGHPREQASFLKTILKGFLEGYTAPNMWRLTLEATLIFFALAAVVILSYAGRIDATVTSVLLVFVFGFLFGKIK